MSATWNRDQVRIRNKKFVRKLGKGMSSDYEKEIRREMYYISVEISDLKKRLRFLKRQLEIEQDQKKEERVRKRK